MRIFLFFLFSTLVLVVFSQSVDKESDISMKNFLLGKYDPAKHPDFVKIDHRYTDKSNIYMHKEAYEAFLRMQDSARKDGIRLIIISATRTFDYQKKIWESKWMGQMLVNGKNLAKTIPDPVERAKCILQYSSLPGTSRHHWGTDIDLNSVEIAYFATSSGKKVFEWLKDHAAYFGFCQPYGEWGAERSTGYQPEPWHWSYMPLAAKFLEAYAQEITYDDLTGFAGSETAASLKVIENYVFGISNNCKEWKE